MNDLEFNFVFDLILLSVPLLLILLCISVFRYILYWDEHPHVSRETKKPVKSWCYDE